VESGCTTEEELRPEIPSAWIIPSSPILRVHDPNILMNAHNPSPATNRRRMLGTTSTLVCLSFLCSARRPPVARGSLLVVPMDEDTGRGGVEIGLYGPRKRESRPGNSQLAATTSRWVRLRVCFDPKGGEAPVLRGPLVCGRRNLSVAH
jgi:hypothetical protein